MIAAIVVLYLLGTVPTSLLIVYFLEENPLPVKIEIVLVVIVAVCWPVFAITVLANFVRKMINR